jgi:hypothetical protein
MKNLVQDFAEVMADQSFQFDALVIGIIMMYLGTGWLLSIGYRENCSLSDLAVGSLVVGLLLLVIPSLFLLTETTPRYLDERMYALEGAPPWLFLTGWQILFAAICGYCVLLVAGTLSRMDLWWERRGKTYNRVRKRSKSMRGGSIWDEGYTVPESDSLFFAGEWFPSWEKYADEFDRRNARRVKIPSLSDFG